jgi:anti-sigma factor (TIGR02949 family)
MKDNTCQKVADKIPLYLDGEMPENEVPIFLEHVKYCSKCMDKYDSERTFKDVVRERCERKCISSSLADTIKNRISMLLARS